MFKNNPDLYPTPEWLVKKMLSKVNFNLKQYIITMLLINREYITPATLY